MEPVVAQVYLDGIEDLKTEMRWVRHKLDRLGEADYSRGYRAFCGVDTVDKEIFRGFWK